MEKIYLNEKKYKHQERIITLIAILILIVGLLPGSFLIYNGIKPNTIKVDELKQELELKKQQLEEKGIKYKSNAKYTESEVYDLMIITNALDPSFNHCTFDEYENNPLTKEYCQAKNNTSEFTTFSKIALGVFICIATCMISIFIFFVAKGRHIAAFTTQQTMPIVKERLDEISPTLGNTAKEITKGIKKGLNDQDIK